MIRVMEQGFGQREPAAAPDRLAASIPMRRYALPEGVAGRWRAPNPGTAGEIRPSFAIYKMALLG